MTPTRAGLLDEVDEGRVFTDAIGDHYVSGDRKVTAQINEMHAAGWVERNPTRAGDYWRVTPLGQAHKQLRIRNYGTHIVAETGPDDDPTPIGEANRRNITGRGRWVVEVGGTGAVCRNANEALAELRRLAVELLVAELTDEVHA
ncbi:hypothetical protein JNW90_00780 [Micromonospora sp. STR1s_5]|nr:hypothetical protein [Micromonospora sp. STR1s_5]